MRNIQFTKDVLPHLLAVLLFFIVTVTLFNPVFLENKVLSQHDISEWEGSSKALRDFRNETGEEGLWANAMFSGMPAYLINVEWANKPVTWIKKVASIGLPHPIENIFLGFVSYYIMLLVFGIRPGLAMAGAIGFGLTTYLIIGLAAGHSGRIGAIAFMPLVLAGIHLLFTKRLISGFAITSLGFALHLRENHVQITYYLAFLLVGYGIMQLVQHLREKRLRDFALATGLTIPAILLAIGTFLGPLWAVMEYSKVTIRGKSELTSSVVDQKDGLTKEAAFDYSSGKTESLMLLFPNAVGGATSNYLVMDTQSKTYKALASSGDQQLANNLARYTSSYWGPQRFTSPYYAGAILVLLFITGIVLADKKYVLWLVPMALIGIVLSWGSNFESFNYFLFDYLPGYNKFRSVTFALVITLFSLPLLAMLGLEKYLSSTNRLAFKKQILYSGGILAAIVFVFAVLPDLFLSFQKTGEDQLPDWLLNALINDRRDLFTADAWRSFLLIIPCLAALYFDLFKHVPATVASLVLILLVWFDLGNVNGRYLTKENFERKHGRQFFTPTAADEAILVDKSNYRVMNLNLQETFSEARTSYFHQSIGGYHGAKIRRYQDLFDSCIVDQTQRMINDLQNGQQDFAKYGALNMLNIKYYVYGQARENIIQNPAASGSVWFASEVREVKSPNEELAMLKTINPLTTAVIDGSKFTIPTIQPDSTATIKLVKHAPNKIIYESSGKSAGLAVFSEIYYEGGWKAYIDSKVANPIRANYVLRALAIPEGNHTIEWRFEPEAYVTGNKITGICSWLVLLVSIGGLGLVMQRRFKKPSDA